MKADREGGRPLDITITKLDVNTITANQGPGRNTFLPPCMYYSYFAFGGPQGITSAESSGSVQVIDFMISCFIYFSPFNIYLVLFAAV